MEQKRRLAAVLFADIAGYTMRAHQDEAVALEVRSRVIETLIASGSAHHGRVVKSLGDGVLLEFPSAFDAVTCARDIQDRMRPLAEESQGSVQVRVGVHVGDVVVEGDDILGNTVNIASRVHSLAQPGGICITREVHAHIRSSMQLECKRVQKGSLFKLPNSVEVFQIARESDSRSPVGRSILVRHLEFLRNSALAALTPASIET